MNSATIVGFGVVGTSTAAALSKAGVSIDVVDPDKGHDDYGKLNAGWIFICVPTPYDGNQPGACDVDAVWDVARAIDSRGGRKQPLGLPGVVLRSTVPPGTTDKLQEAFPHLSIVHWPEFLTEVTSVRDGLEPSRVVIGYTDKSIVAAVKLLDLCQHAPFIELVPARAAEMVKYMANTFYATTVSFANQVYDLCQKVGVDYEVVRRCAEHDPMMARFHLDVHHKGSRGYAGKCLPKDAKALRSFAAQNQVTLSVLDAADDYNDKLRSDR